MLKYMNKNVFTHQIWPHFYTNGIFQTKEHGSPPKTFHTIVPRWLEPIWGSLLAKKMCGYVGPLNMWEFHARVFSLAGGVKKFCTGAGGFGLQEITRELVIKCAWNLSMVHSQNWAMVAINKMHGYMATMNLWEFNAGFGARRWQTITQLRWRLWCRMNHTRASYHVCLKSFHGKFAE